MPGGKAPATSTMGAVMREKGRLTRCGSVVAPVAMTLYGAARKLAGNFTELPRPKKVPSPGQISWSAVRDV